MLNEIRAKRPVYSPLLNVLQNPNKKTDFDKDLVKFFNKIRMKGPEKNSISLDSDNSR